MEQYTVIMTKSFRKDAKRLRGNERVKRELSAVVDLLVSGQPLPGKYKDHALIGNKKGKRDCHLLPDVLLLYHRDEQARLITLVRIGSHAIVFGI